MSIWGLFIGLVAGVFSGLIGIGGGVIMIPALIFIMGYEQHLAQGTTLAAMVLPIGFFAALEYYRGGYVNIPVALLIALGFVVGGYFGARFAVGIDADLLRKIMGAVLLVLSVRMIMMR